MNNTSTKTLFAVLATALIAVAAFAVPFFGSSSYAAGTGTSESDPFVQESTKGQTWEYTPEFPEGLNPTVTIEKQGYGTSFSTASGGTYATYSGGKVTVAIPTNAQSGAYYIILKAETTHPTQVARQYIQFNISDVLTITGDGNIVTYVGNEVEWTPTSNASSLGGGAFTVSPQLPAGLSINSATGAITGTPTAAAAEKTYTVTVKTTTPAQTKTVQLSIFVEDTIVIGGDETVYAATNGTQDAAQVSSNISGVEWSISNAGDLDGKVFIDQSGNITVSAASGDNGSHTITVQAVSEETGQTVTKQISVEVAMGLEFGTPEFTIAMSG